MYEFYENCQNFIYFYETKECLTTKITITNRKVRITFKLYVLKTHDFHLEGLPNPT